MIDQIRPFAGFDYIQNNNPTIDVNPNALGKTWLNISTGEIFVCTDATTGTNTWVGQLGNNVSPFYRVLFDGASDYADTRYTVSYPITIEIKCKLPVIPINSILLGYGFDYSNNKGFLIKYTTEHKIHMYLGNTTSNIIKDIPIDTEYHMYSVVVNSGNALTLYVDGVSKGTDTVSALAIQDHNLSIASEPIGANLCNMEVSEFRFWGVEKSQQDIATSMSYKLIGSEDNLDIYYPIREGSSGSTIFTDYGSSGTNMDIYGSPIWYLDN